MSSMKVALVSPYSWSYPGGVTRHIDALAQQFMADGHDVRVLAPFDPVDLGSTALHRGARPVAIARPDYVIRHPEPDPEPKAKAWRGGIVAAPAPESSLKVAPDGSVTFRTAAETGTEVRVEDDGSIVLVSR